MMMSEDKEWIDKNTSNHSFSSNDESTWNNDPTRTSTSDISSSSAATDTNNNKSALKAISKKIHGNPLKKARTRM